MQRVYFILPLCTFSKNNECLFAPVQHRFRDAGRWKNLGEPVVMKWTKSDHLVVIGFTDMSKIGWQWHSWHSQFRHPCNWFLAPLTFHLNFIQKQVYEEIKERKNGYRTGWNSVLNRKKEKLISTTKWKTGDPKRWTIYFPLLYLVKSSENILFFYLHFTWLCGSWNHQKVLKK